jgi:eukaryotic-like serine/threonine-protein kinase
LASLIIWTALCPPKALSAPFYNPCETAHGVEHRETKGLSNNRRARARNTGQSHRKGAPFQIVTGGPLRAIVTKRCVGQCAKDSRFAVLVNEAFPSMPLPQSSMNRSTPAWPESADPFAMQLALSRVHARLVPMQRDEQGYVLDPSAEAWVELPADRGFAGYGLSRALRMLLDVLRGLTALHDTFDTEGVTFAHGEVALTQFRVDSEGVCRLVPLTARHSSAESKPSAEVLGQLAPERLLGEPVDPRADVFSAGVLLWEALAGRRLFTETTADAIIERLMGEKLQMPQLPPELAWAIPLKSIAARALSVDPYQRFADCAELATAIAIVARERVATHAEIAAFFGSKARSHNSVAQKRPIPTRSSTFPSVSLPASLPASPPSINAPPSSRNGFPLVTHAPRSAAPRSVPPAPRSLTPAPRSLTPAPRSVTPAPGSVHAAPSAQRNLTHKSPFATLLGTAESVPTSYRRQTLMSVGTPAAVLAPIEAVPESGQRASKLPSQPVWDASVSTAPAPAWRAPMSSSTVARATLDSIPLSDVAKFRGWSSRRSLVVLTLVALLAAVVALVAIQSSSEAPDTATNHRVQQAATPGAVAPRTAVSEPVATSDESTQPTPPSATDPSNGTPASAPKEIRPASKAASPTTTSAGSSVTKDYGI